MTSLEHPDSEQVMAWVDGELRGGDEVAVRQHVQTCGACQALADDMRLVSRQLREWPVGPAPVSIDPLPNATRRGLLRTPAIANSPWRPLPDWSVSRWKWGLAAAILLLASVSVTQLRRSSSTQDAQPAAQAFVGANRTSPQAFDNDAAITMSLGGAPPQPAGFQIARTAGLQVTVANLDEARASVEQHLATRRGYAAHLAVSEKGPDGRTLIAKLRVPSDQLEAALAVLRTVGRVTGESQSAEDVTAQSVDLEARLANARRTEGRLVAVLEGRAGSVADVLEVEREMARVRGEIERMVAEQKHLAARVDFATIDLRIDEERRAGFDSPMPSLGRQLRNAAIEGVGGAVDFGTAVVMFVLRIGPTVLICLTALAWPLRAWWRRRSAPIAAS